VGRYVEMVRVGFGGCRCVDGRRDPAASESRDRYDDCCHRVEAGRGACRVQLRVVGDSRVVAPNRWPHERARQEVEAPKRALDGMETRRDNIIPRGALAEGNINSSDHIVVELLRPPDMPQMIMIRWPQHSTMVAPTRFTSTASEIARLFARASTELTWIKARRL
jgi:hypothetical protein